MTRVHLVLLPGLDGTGKLFRDFSKAAASHADLTVVDYATPELHRYPECRAAAERCLPSDGSYVLVGESFSGPIAIAIAASRPSGLRGVVLAGSFASCPRPALGRLTALLPLMPTHRPSWVLDCLLLGRHATMDRSRMVRESLALVSPRAIRARMKEVARVDVRRDLAQIDVPILYLRASEDRLVPSECGDEVARLARRVTVAEVVAPHMLLQCAPSECARLIVQFSQDVLPQ